jgi:hypothetical protein
MGLEWKQVHYYAAIYWRIVPAPMQDGGECGVISEINEWHGKPKYSEKTCRVPLCPPEVPHVLTRARTRVSAVGTRRRTILSYGTAIH